MGRTEYVHDPEAPAPNSLVVAASAVVTDEEGRVLLQRRSDNARWSVPGGAMELGESIADTAVREVKEETGFDVVIERLVGIYSDPGHVVAYSDGEVRQQFSICFACRIVGGAAATSEESMQVAFFTVEELADLDISPAIQMRIEHFLEGSDQPVIA